MNTVQEMTIIGTQAGPLHDYDLIVIGSGPAGEKAPCADMALCALPPSPPAHEARPVPRLLVAMHG